MSDNRERRDNGTHLRDARLARALDHAPDMLEEPQPAAQRRDAILRAAHAAVAQPAPPAWRAAWVAVWDRLAGTGRMPWNAALATVVLASFITLMWQNEPLPSAQIDAPIPVPSASSGSPLPSAQSAQEKSPADEPATAAPAKADRSETAAAAPTAGSVTTPLKQRHAANRAPAPRAPVAPRSEAAQTAAVPRAAPPVVAAHPPAALSAPAALDNSALADAAPTPGRERQKKSNMAKRAPPVSTVAALPRDWTELRIGEGVVVARGATGDLPGLLASLQGVPAPLERPTEGQEATAREADGNVQVIRLELLRAGQVLGSLELSGRRWRFVPRAGSGLMASQGWLSAAEAEALQANVQGLRR